MHDQIGQLKVRVQFIVVTKMAVECNLGAAFTDRHVKAILPSTRRVLFHHAQSVAITGATKLFLDSNSNKKQPISRSTVYNKARLSKAVLIPAMTQMYIQVQTPEAGLRFLHNHPKLVRKHLSLTANGIMDIIPHSPFLMNISNFGAKTVRLPKMQS